MTRKASDAAIERACEMLNSPDGRGYRYRPVDYRDDYDLEAITTHLQSLSDALRAHFGADVPASLAGDVLPVVVDPIVAAARRICAAVSKDAHEHGAASDYARGLGDQDPAMIAAIAELRAIAAQGGGE